MLLVCRYRVAAPDAGTFAARAEPALVLLSAQDGCRSVTLARAVEYADRWLLIARFDSVAAYRRALSPFEVREVVVPFLSRADPPGPGSSGTGNLDSGPDGEPATFEPILDAAGGVLTRSASLLAEDADRVRVGEAGGPVTPR